MTATDQSGTHLPLDVLDDLTNCAYGVLADGNVTFGEVVTLGGVLASKVSQFVQLSGHQKQEVVMTVVECGLQKILKEKLATFPEDQREAFRQKVETASAFAKETLPSVLTLAVQASRGELNFGTLVRSADVAIPCEGGPLSCLNRVFPLFPCMRRVQAETPPKSKEALQLEMKSLGDNDQFSKEPSHSLTEEDANSQENHQANTVAQ